MVIKLGKVVDVTRGYDLGQKIDSSIIPAKFWRYNTAF